MKPEHILIPGIIGGIWLLCITFLSDTLAVIVAPYDIFEIGGMRSADDPVMLLFFLYPFVFAFIAAGVYDLVKGSFEGPRERKGIVFGIILILLVLVPDMIVIYSSMAYPAGFYISNIISGIVGYLVLGLIFAVLGERGSRKERISQS